MFKTFALLSTALLAVQGANPTSSLMDIVKEKNLTQFARVLKLTKLDTELSMMQNITVFAPTDDAFEAAGWDFTEEFYTQEGAADTDRVGYLKKLMQFHVGNELVKVEDIKGMKSTDDATKVDSIYSTPKQGPKSFELFRNATTDMPYVIDMSSVLGNITHVDTLYVNGSLNVIDIVMAGGKFTKDPIDSNNWLWLVVLGAGVVAIGGWLASSVICSAQNAKKALAEENMSEP